MQKVYATLNRMLVMCRSWHEVARHDALLTARKRQFSKPVAFVYLIARPFLRLDNSPTVSAEAERFFSKQSPLAADAVMGHFGWLRTGFDRLSPNGVDTSPCQINSNRIELYPAELFFQKMCCLLEAWTALRNLVN